MSAREGFAKLSGVMESLKAQDAARLKETQAALEALDRKRHALEMQILATQGSLDPGDLPAAAGFERWRALQRRRIGELAVERGALEAVEETQRQALLRSNGEAEALKQLAKAPKKSSRRGS